jgi:transcriptional regulator with XRE-family HTH domain
VDLVGGENKMFIGQRVRQLREEKGLSQGDVERASGMLRTYISRVENGHSVPSLDTLERFATALDVPLYQLFRPGNGFTPRPKLPSHECIAEEPGPNGSDDRLLLELRGLTSRMAESDRTLLLDFASRLASR